MRIFNQDKTRELEESAIDFEQGQLVPDKLLVAHHEAIAGKSAETIANELILSGEICNLRYDGNWYKQTVVYDNGGVEEEQINSIEPQDAWDETEDILIYVPYTAEELQKRVDEKHYYELKEELLKVMEDIGQEQLGLVRNDYAEKKTRAAEIINELRVLEGKEPRALKTE